ncbi:MAG: D-glycerate dehydrogenase [Candidatus Methanomethylicota archaeon]|uniref:D-glycerate dehydrogenase n=1 Tax=Thermoproteota archaeon TaxID=2056631 RepID=A0A497EUK1_9CREN|nr:MAG: D-glycerate dehydrogenase [Candidatus Verstraetearchaeota archaeon]
MKPKVFITRELPGKAIELISEYYEVEVWREYYPPPKDVIIRKIKDLDALASLLTDRIDSEVLGNASKLRIIAQYAVGYDNIDIEECTKRGIYVTNTPGVLTEAVADLTWALLLAVARRIVEADNFVRSGAWERTRTGWHPLMMLGVDVHGKTLGIIGLGRIGSAVARRAKCFNMRILYYDIERKIELERELGVQYVDLDSLLKNSDFISIHVPLTKATYHLIGERELKLMKPSAYLINTSRGAVIDEKALIKALENKWIAGAALDVFEIEPTPKNNPLLKFPNIVVAPHIGSASRETREKMALMVAENLIKFAKGEIPPNLVNKNVVKIRSPGFT